MYLGQRSRQACERAWKKHQIWRVKRERRRRKHHIQKKIYICKVYCCYRKCLKESSMEVSSWGLIIYSISPFSSLCFLSLVSLSKKLFVSRASLPQNGARPCSQLSHPYSPFGIFGSPLQNLMRYYIYILYIYKR